MTSRQVSLSKKLAGDYLRYLEISQDLSRAEEALLILDELRGGSIEHRDSIIANLFDSAVVGYCMCFALSKGRASLDLNFVPTTHRDTHDLIREYRNRVVAHVDSDFQVTQAAVTIVREGEQLHARHVVGFISRPELPDHVADLFRQLVAAVLDAVDVRVATERALLEAQLQTMDLQPLWDLRPSARTWNPFQWTPSKRRTAPPEFNIELD